MEYILEKRLLHSMEKEMENPTVLEFVGGCFVGGGLHEYHHRWRAVSYFGGPG